MKSLSAQALSDVTVFAKYARYDRTLGRRENWRELVNRNKAMHLRKYPHMSEDIERAYELVYTKKVLPSMRSLQFGGAPIERDHNRIYNCAYMPIDDIAAFSELMFLLLGGTGGGFSVQSHHIAKLPKVQKPAKAKSYVAEDTIEGWADCIKVLMQAFFEGSAYPIFDLSHIREKGAELITTGGKAPGPVPLMECLVTLEGVLRNAVGRSLKTIEAHDICCIIADAVLAGGIRRAALISLFDRFDEDMLNSKVGPWWEETAYRGRANNSAVLPRGEVTEEEFMAIMKVVEKSGCGEPGVYWTSNIDWGTNPCCEIALRPYQFCNLCEVNADDITDQKDFEDRCWAAALIGTLQAGYTNFHYLRECWQEATELDALIGVGMTGIGSGAVLGLDLVKGAKVVKMTNEIVARIIGINAAARTTTVKPSGTSSLVLGSSSGIHAWHNDFYVRRMRMGKNEAIYKYLYENHPHMVEDDERSPTQAVATFPQKAPEGAILRTESSKDLLERILRFNIEWVHSGHRDGDNTHNVSCTISLKDDEWNFASQWMWDNRSFYNGISVLPYNGGTFVQAPFEDITEEEFERLNASFQTINLDDVKEEQDETALTGEIACAGGACAI